jgi:hypothetical protein
MSATSLDAALERLAASLARLEDAVERRLDGDRALAGHGVEVQALSDDRARLAGELDDSFARLAELQSANRDVSRRLGEAIETIRAVLEPQPEP